jgi:hypothetical protein
MCPEAAVPRFLLTQPSMAQGGYSLLSAAVVIVGFNTREPVLLIQAFDRGLVGMTRNFASGKMCATAAAHCAVFASRLLSLPETSGCTIWIATVEAHYRSGSCSYSQ